jgi:hypothetical protein
VNAHASPVAYHRRLRLAEGAGPRSRPWFSGGAVAPVFLGLALVAELSADRAFLARVELREREIEFFPVSLTTWRERAAA